MPDEFESKLMYQLRNWWADKHNGWPLGEFESLDAAKQRASGKKHRKLEWAEEYPGVLWRAERYTIEAIEVQIKIRPKPVSSDPRTMSAMGLKFLDKLGR